ncbi:AMP_1a_G0012500.mRNA.1.CDS.1 [Saccharomyces cerevisiae]|nr:AMP_1a_G0012500.mRNA.1.CDS.1 [Saccharomyces cerevisiae]CAI6513197.1 AMP_1a_G0012500.mRNA.1.CDS.1 [Saccharomyces cerevisiae]
MLRNDEEYKRILGRHQAISWGPCRIFEIFWRKKERSTLRYREIMLGTWPLLEEEETISVLDSTKRASKGSQVFRMSGRQIKELYYKVWSNLRESKTEVLQYFLNWDEKKCREEWEAKDDTVFVEALEKSWSFSAFAFHDERWTAGVRSTSSCSLASIIDS